MRRIVALILTVVLLMSCLPLSASAGMVMVFDGNALAERSREEIGSRYTQALSTGLDYVNGDSGSYYSVAPSLTAPYGAGALTASTVSAMSAMTDFYRWLTGVKPLKKASVNTDALQKGALVRNWDFNHTVSVSKKPADMDSTLWNEGAKASHNIIASGFTPVDAITGWMNEGYNTNSGRWDTIGHRVLLTGANIGQMNFGYAGRIAIGHGADQSNEWNSNAFAAFPAPGYMPLNLLSGQQSAWSVELNPDKLTYSALSDLTVCVKDKASGKSYTCTSANGGLVNIYGTLAFRQPECKNGYYGAGASYEVEITGLKNVTFGHDAEITYTVEFFDLKDYRETVVTGFNAPDGWNRICITEENNNQENLTILTAILPQTIAAKTEAGGAVLLPVKGRWTLDMAARCWRNTVDVSRLPEQVTDPEHLLDRITIPYEITEYAGDFHVPYEGFVAGTTEEIKFWPYSGYMEHGTVYHITGSAESGYRAEARHDQTDIDDKNIVEWKWNHLWQKEDSGFWVGTSSFGRGSDEELYVAQIRTIGPRCLHPVTHTQRFEPTCMALGRVSEVCDSCGKILEDYELLDCVDHKWSEEHTYPQLDALNITLYYYNCEYGCGATRYWGIGNDLEEVLHLIDCPSVKFKDISYMDWYHEAVDFAIDQGLMKGVSDTSFAPEDSMTRAMLVTVLWRYEGQPHADYEGFSDVPENQWYYSAVMWAAANGIVNGVGHGRFDPDGQITREQMAAILYRYAAKKGLPISSSSVDLSAYPDGGEVSSYAVDPVKWAVAEGLITGSREGNVVRLIPGGNATRSQVAAILMRFIKNYQN